MIWSYFDEMLRVTESAFAQQKATRPPYTGPQRRRTDAIEVEARVVDELAKPQREALP